MSTFCRWHAPGKSLPVVLRESTRYIAHGSRILNLHSNMAGLDLNFFTLLSSTGAVFANGGQSNYANRVTFLDGLARFRLARSDKAISQNQGMIVGEISWPITMMYVTDLYGKALPGKLLLMSLRCLTILVVLRLVDFLLTNINSLRGLFEILGAWHYQNSVW